LNVISLHIGGTFRVSENINIDLGLNYNSAFYENNKDLYGAQELMITKFNYSVGLAWRQIINKAVEINFGRKWLFSKYQFSYCTNSFLVLPSIKLEIMSRLIFPASIKAKPNYHFSIGITAS
jgi:hypothetical protein